VAPAGGVERLARSDASQNAPLEVAQLDGDFARVGVGEEGDLAEVGLQPVVGLSGRADRVVDLWRRQRLDRVDPHRVLGRHHTWSGLLVQIGFAYGQPGLGPGPFDGSDVEAHCVCISSLGGGAPCQGRRTDQACSRAAWLLAAVIDRTRENLSLGKHVQSSVYGNIRPSGDGGRCAGAQHRARSRWQEIGEILGVIQSACAQIHGQLKRRLREQLDSDDQRRLRRLPH
jgi:hypothetical protein